MQRVELFQVFSRGSSGYTRVIFRDLEIRRKVHQERMGTDRHAKIIEALTVLLQHYLKTD